MNIVQLISTSLNRLRLSKFRERRALKAFSSVDLRENDVAIDCGANVGDVTEQLSRFGATVYAFEPNPYAFERLRARFSGRENVHCLQKGVYDRNENKKLYFHENSDADEVRWSTGSSMLEVKNNVLGDKFIEVPVIDLSEFIESLGGRIKLVKIDVEGVECPIVKKLITSGAIYAIDHVFVETHEKKTPQLQKETEELRRLIRNKGIRNINLNWT